MANKKLFDITNFGTGFYFSIILSMGTLKVDIVIHNAATIVI